MRIFVSYGRADRERVEPLAQALIARGHEVWWDRHLVGGSAFANEIEKRLADAERVLVAWSAASVGSDWVRDEAGVARDRGILVPVQLDVTPPPLGFKQYQTVDLSHWRGAADAPEMAALDAALGGAVTIPGPRAATPAHPRRWLPFAAGGALAAAVAAFFVLRPTATAADTQPHVALGKFETTTANLAPGFATQLGAETLSAFGTESRVAVSADDGRAGADTWRLSGAVAADDKGLNVIARLVDPASGVAVFTPRAEIETRYARAAARLLGAKLAAGVRCTLRAARARPSLGPQALIAWGKYCTDDTVGKFEDFVRFGAEDARRVTELAPNFAAAWGGLAAALSAKNDPGAAPAIEAAAKRALALDSNEAFGWGALANLAADRGDFVSADDLIQKGIAANPGDCACQADDRAKLLSHLGRVRDTLPLLERATALEPLRARYQVAVADAHAYIGDFADAERGLKAAGEQDPRLPVDVYRFEVAMWAKDYALAKTLAGADDDPLRPVRAALADAAARGDGAAMRRAAEALDQRFESLPGATRGPATALLQIGGRGDRALARIEAAVQKGERNSMILLYAPPMDAERRTNEFAAVAERLHLTDYWRRSGHHPDFCALANPPALCATLTRKG